MTPGILMINSLFLNYPGLSPPCSPCSDSITEAASGFHVELTAEMEHLLGRTYRRNPTDESIKESSAGE
jgi:hypothetical protein